VASKLRILNSAEIAVLNGDDGAVVIATEKWTGKKVFFTLGSPRPGEVGVVEDLLVDRAFVTDLETAEVIAELGEITPFAPHSVLNSLAASSMALAIGASHENIRKAIQEFRPGRHRIELVLEANGIKWINDSKATNPHAALASISAFKSVIWIAGGLSKGAKMEALISRGRSHIKVAILIGTDRGHIAQALERLAPEIPMILVDKPSNLEKSLMEEIVSVSLSQARSGDVVLLAPACASMDQFISYADRGEQFSEAVLKLVETNEK
jgi:UDP-N-acetylmuramoylalanine--D-glutamate ligase